MNSMALSIHSIKAILYEKLDFQVATVVFALEREFPIPIESPLTCLLLIVSYL
jgi:hypothetical protein